MIAVLFRLWRLRQRGVVRQFFRSLRQPVRFAGAVVAVGGLSLLVWTSARDGHERMARESFAILGAMLFTMSVASSFLQQGPRFAPADVDFLFPAPISPRWLLVWRLMQLWPVTLLSVLFMTLAFGLRVARPGRFYVALVLLQMTALHLQLLISVLLTRLSDRASRRLRGAGRTVASLVIAAALVCLIVAVANAGGLREWVAPAASSPAARILFFPSAAAVDFVYGETPLDTGFALVRLVLGAAGTLALLLLPEVDYLEDSVTTTARVARALAARRRGEIVVGEAGGARTGRSLALPPSRLLFRGAGVLVWKNLLLLLRSWKAVVPGVAVGLLVVLPGLLAMRRGDGTAHVAVGSLALATIFWSSALSFDLRREFDRLDELRALPLRPGALVFAELLVPWAIGVALQESLLIVIASGPASAGLQYGALAAAMPLLMFVAVVIDNLALFLFAPKGAVTREGGGSPGQALRPLAWMAAITPGLFVWFRLSATTLDPFWPVAAGVAVNVAIATSLFLLLVRLYEARSAEAA